MTTSGNSSVTLLLVTGLLSVGMAAIGYYYLQMNSKKPRTLSNDSSEAGGQETSLATTRTEKEKNASVRSTVTDIQASSAGTCARVSRTTSKTIAATVSETVDKTVAIEMPKLLPASPKKAPESPKTTVEKIVEPFVKVLEPPIVAEALKVSCSPNKTLESSPKKIAGSPKNEVESPVFMLSNPFNISPKKTHENPKKVFESPKKTVESLKKTVVETEATTVEQPKQDQVGQIETPESPKKKIAGPEKVTEPARAIEELKSVTRKVIEDFIVAQAVTETASEFTDAILQESLENIALEQEEYVQVELTQSMTLSQSTPELINIEDAVVITEEVVQTSTATEDEEGIVKEEQEHAHILFERIEPASAELVVDAAAKTEMLASPKTPCTTPVSWEAITLSPETKAVPAEEAATPLSLDAPAESIESTEPLSINVPAENIEALAEDKNASSPVDSGGSTPGKRNRNRSKKSKSKKKKGKKHQKVKA